jgi:hypothetical protein
MTLLRRIFLAKEQFETYCTDEIVKLFASTNGKFAFGLLVKCTIAVVLIMVSVSSLFNAGGPKFSAYYYPVKQGEYKPRTCSTWQFLPNSEGFLKQSLGLLSLASQESGQSLTTGNHIGLPMCIVQYLDEQMLNPHIITWGEETYSFYFTSTRLCAPRPVKEQMEMIFAHKINLGWVTADRTPKNQTYIGIAAHELQLALRMINGADICNDKVK